MSLQKLNQVSRQIMGLKVFGRRFANDRRGVSAIEFALVAPFLIMAYLGMAELTLGMMASRRASHLAATIGDLTAQSETIDVTSIKDLWAIGTSMMQPFASASSSGGPLKIRLISVTMQSDSSGKTAGIARVNWCQQTASQSAACPKKNDPVSSVTTDQIGIGESLILTQVDYRFDSPIGNFIKNGTVFSYTFQHHPRNGIAVACATC